MTYTVNPKVPLKNKVSPELIRRILPDLSVEIVGSPSGNQTNCKKVTFKVTLDAGAVVGPGNRPVKVRVLDAVDGVSTVVGEVVLYLPVTGGSAIASIEWKPADAKFHPDWDNEITVLVDPDNTFAERNERNNTITFVGHCIG